MSDWATAAAAYDAALRRCERSLSARERAAARVAASLNELGRVYDKIERLLSDLPLPMEH